MGAACRCGLALGSPGLGCMRHLLWGCAASRSPFAAPVPCWITLEHPMHAIEPWSGRGVCGCSGAVACGGHFATPRCELEWMPHVVHRAIWHTPHAACGSTWRPGNSTGGQMIGLQEPAPRPYLWHAYFKGCIIFMCPISLLVKDLLCGKCTVEIEPAVGLSHFPTTFLMGLFCEEQFSHVPCSSQNTDTYSGHPLCEPCEALWSILSPHGHIRGKSSFFVSCGFHLWKIIY